MAKVIAVTDAVKSLAELHSRLGLTQAEDPQSFDEWCTNLPELTGEERNRLATLRQRLLYHRTDGDLLEGAVMRLVASPLLELAGFYDAPFKLKAEAAVEISVDDGEEVLRGRIDASVIQPALCVRKGSFVYSSSTFSTFEGDVCVNASSPRSLLFL